MIYVDTYFDKDGYNIIEIDTDDGNFRVHFCPNLDLYWSYIPKESFLDSPDKVTINITKENNYLYNLIKDLYNAIKLGKPYYNNSYPYDIESKDKKCDNKDLFVDNEVKWYSDEDPTKEASLLEISKGKESYKIEFNKSKRNMFFNTYAIRFRNSGSRYEPYNVTFMDMYHKLLEYDNQMCFEELLYEKEKIKKLKKGTKR